MTARRCPAWCTDHLEHEASVDGAFEHRGEALQAPVLDLQAPLVVRAVQEVNAHGAEDAHLQMSVPRTGDGLLELDLAAAEAHARHVLAVVEAVRGRALSA